MLRRVRLAILIAIVLNGVLILTARYRLSYDAYTHMLLADHYRQDWWSLWDPTWYAGFTVVSYPPLVHQLIGLFGRLIGVDAGYALVSWVVLSVAPLAVYAFSRIFVSQEAAGYASLGAALLPSIYLTAYSFGQLPTLASLVFALFCAASLAEFLRSGRRISGTLAVLLAVVMMGAHHATLLFLPWIIMAVVIHLLLNRETNWKPLLIRLVSFGLFAGAAALLVIWPFWRWGLGQTLQTPIDHPTRHNYLIDGYAALNFFWSMYGPLVVLIPFALWKILNRRYTGLAAAFLALFLLGLGGTTPLPRLIFGSGWEWLTYDRFALWASIILLPFYGTIMSRPWPKVSIRSDWLIKIINPILVKPAWKAALKKIPPSFTSSMAVLVSVSTMAAVSLVVSLYPTFLPTQPPQVNMQPIVDFLAEANRSQWRYLTFGFGDQFAYLNRLTKATTIDGSYHTARTLPELRASGLGQIDTAYWLPGGLARLDPILQAAGAYGVRWGFVDLIQYDPVLLRNGWTYLATLANGVEVWENPGAIQPMPFNPPPSDPLASFSWGFLPLAAFALTTALAGLRFRPEAAQKALFGLHALAIGLLPVSLMFWSFRPLTAFEAPRVYFTYNNALFYLSDGLAIMAISYWALGRWFGPRSSENRPGHLKARFSQIFSWPLSRWLLALCTLATLSILWSGNWQESLYISLHLWLVYGLFLSLVDRSGVWRFASFGFCIALAIQVVTGVWEFIVQSTGFLAAFHLTWPGAIVPSISGASIVQLANGERILRAYGTLPHPNILGTFMMALLSGPAILYAANRKLRIWPILLFVAGLVLLVFAFSRAAWIGLFAGAILALVKLRNPIRKRMLVLGFAGALSLAATIIPLRDLILTRVSIPAVSLAEQISVTGRTWLADQALAMISSHPILGSGAGLFALDLAQRAPIGYMVEPVHNLPLLITSDLGILGGLILLGLGLAIFRDLRKVRKPVTIILSAALIGLCATSLFDHSLWSLAPGRILVGLMLGLWAGQVRGENEA